MKPKYIDNKAKIYLIAPSFGCTTTPYKERLDAAIVKLKSLGHQLTIGPNCYLDIGQCASNTKEARAIEFMAAYSSDCDCIMSVGGGEMMVEILDFIDYKKIAKLPPKWFVGFSDNTNLCFTLATMCDLETVYGCCAGAFGFPKYQYDIADTYQMLCGKKEFKGYKKYQKNKISEDPFAPYNLDTIKKITAYNYEKPFSGFMIGGTLDCLQLLCGTNYDRVKKYAKQKTDGLIFYLEACDLSVLDIKRALIQLKRAGWFNNVKGFLIGRPLAIDEEIGSINHLNAVTDVLSSFNVPILLDIDLGHLPPSMPFRNNAYATVSYEKNNIFIKYAD